MDAQEIVRLILRLIGNSRRINQLPEVFSLNGQDFFIVHSQQLNKGVRIAAENVLTPSELIDIVVLENVNADFPRPGNVKKIYIATEENTLSYWNEFVGDYVVLIGGSVVDAIVNGVTDRAPSQNAVFDALFQKVDKIEGEGLTPQKYTLEEKQKLAALEASKFKGTYLSLTALESAFPTAEEGSSAHVDSGVGESVQYYIWDNNDGVWTIQAGGSTSETAASVKVKYESNPDTNAFTDSYKAQVDNSTLHAARKDNPHEVTKEQVGLGNVNNTSDANKPISLATATALTLKANNADVVKMVNGYEPDELGRVVIPVGGTSTSSLQLVSFDPNWQSGLTFFPIATWMEEGVIHQDSREITLDAADPSLDRFDLFAINLSTNQIEVITGDPADPAVEPSYNPLTHLAANFISIEAGAIVPSNNNPGTIIFAEQTNWSSAGAGASFDLQNIESPAGGTYAIKTVNALTNGQPLPFIAPSAQAFVDGMKIVYKIKNIVGGLHRWLVEGVRSNGRQTSLYIDAPTNYSPSSTLYQSLSVTIPTGTFTQITKISLVSGVAGLRYFLDDVELRSGDTIVVSGDFADRRLANVVSDLTDAEALLIRNKLKIAQVNGVTEQYVIDGDNTVRAEFAAADNDLALQIDAIEEANLIQDAQINNRVVKITGKGLSTEDYTTAEKTKLAGLEGTKFKGTFLNTTALNTAYPAGEAGWYADVDAGAGAVAKRYIWDAQEGWVPSTGDIAGETAESIRVKYLSNAGTEEFTTTYKNKVDSMTAIFTTALKDKLDSITAIFTTALKAAYDTASNWVSTNGQNVLDRLGVLERAPIAVNTSRVLAATDHNRVLLITAPITLTWPAGGLTPFKVNFDVDSTGTLTIADQAATAGNDLDAPDGKILEAGKMAHAYKRPDNIKLRLKGTWKV